MITDEQIEQVISKLEKEYGTNKNLKLTEDGYAISFYEYDEDLRHKYNISFSVFEIETFVFSKRQETPIYPSNFNENHFCEFYISSGRIGKMIKISKNQYNRIYQLYLKNKEVENLSWEQYKINKTISDINIFLGDNK